MTSLPQEPLSMSPLRMMLPSLYVILDSSGQLVVSPKVVSVARYNCELQDRLKKAALTHPDCTSWYTAGDGTAVRVWPGSAVEYQQPLSTIDWSDYDIEGSRRDLRTKLRAK